MGDLTNYILERDESLTIERAMRLAIRCPWTDNPHYIRSKDRGRMGHYVCRSKNDNSIPTFIR